MPTATGGETIDERLTRLRADLARVRQTIARAVANGQGFSIGGTAVSQVAYDRALQRQRELEPQITALEARKAGTGARPGLAVTVTKMS